MPCVDSVIAGLRTPWGSACCLCPDLGGIPDLHESTCAALLVVGPPPPGFVPSVVHIFTDGFFFPPQVDDYGGDSGPRSAWALVFVLESCHGDFFLGGSLGDFISVDFDTSCGFGSRDVGAYFHSPLNAEYVADVFALLWICQCPFVGCRFVVHGDCVCPIYSGSGAQSWASEPTPHLIASLVTAIQCVLQLELAHVKSHIGHPWNEAADAVARHCALSGGPVGLFPLRPVPFGLRDNDCAQ